MPTKNKMKNIIAGKHFVNDDDLTKCVRYYSSAVFRRSLMRFGLMPAPPSFYCKKAVYDKYGAFDTSYKVAVDFEKGTNGGQMINEWY